jgi:carbonic anhydrase
MRLFEAIIDANHRALAGDQAAGLRPGDYLDELPLAALTCIDSRLNPLMPEALGIPEDQFIWLRNAGNIITSTTSSTMRSLALACSIKGSKEIAIIGHTDCRVRQTSVADLIDKFRALGIDRARLPENLHEFFGLFASERQNVLRVTELVRQSPLIGPKVPVQGLLVDIETGKLEWLINGYETLGSTVAATQQATAPLSGAPGLPELLRDGGVAAAAPGPVPLGKLAGFNFGEMKFPEGKIGEVVTAAANAVLGELRAEAAAAQPAQGRASKPAGFKFDHASLYKIVGNDKKIYGPVSGQELEQWLAEGRVLASTLVQKVGYKEWRQLAAYAENVLHAPIPVPPPLSGSRPPRRGN